MFKAIRKIFSYLYTHQTYTFIIYISCLLMAIIFLVVMFMHRSIIGYSGFAVDGDERVYIGSGMGDVNVFEGQKKLGSFSLTSRGYEFTIQNGYEMILCHSEQR